MQLIIYMLSLFRLIAFQFLAKRLQQVNRMLNAVRLLSRKHQLSARLKLYDLNRYEQELLSYLVKLDAIKPSLSDIHGNDETKKMIISSLVFPFKAKSCPAETSLFTLTNGLLVSGLCAYFNLFAFLLY